MKRFKFAAREFCFPCWGSLAIEMAGEAGFSGLQLADAGGYLQPHPGNNGYVEYERYGLDLRRKDSFPLTLREVQEDYLESASASGVELVSIYLYTLEHQGFIKYSRNTPQGAQCMESIQSAVLAASQMGIPIVTIPAKGMFGVAQNEYALSMLQYAIETAEDHGVQIAACVDPQVRRRLLNTFKGKLKLEIDTLSPMVQGVGCPEEVTSGLDADCVSCFRMEDAYPDDEGFFTPETSEAALLGQGKAGFSRQAQAIVDSGYTGWILSGTPYYHPHIQSRGEDYVSLAAKDVLALSQAFHQS